MTHKTIPLVFVAVWLFLSPWSLAEDVVFIKDGKKVSGFALGDWSEHGGGLRGEGVDAAFFYADRKIGDGDFRVTARLQLERLNGSAAAICFNNNTTRF